MEDEANDAYEADRSKKTPLGSRLTTYKGNPILLKRELIVTGSQMVNARSSNGNNGLPAVDVTLNGPGGRAMLKNTQQNVGKRMAVLSIDKTRVQPGEQCSGVRNDNWCTQEKVISSATIQGVFGERFIITGLSGGQASELALLLRAGSLETPIALVASTVIGPGLGQDNIDRGKEALAIGLGLTFVFMAIYYRAFGWIANAVLLSNLILTVGMLSLIQASLSLPGIAAVVFHLGIAVDANILIYERIREELRLGNSPQAAINAGFDKAFATIADSNVTTLIAGVVLMALGSGAILSFAIVMTLGIITSLFTSVVGSRALVHAIWGRRKRVQSLSI
jgi:preprotein translocase subunit SecD